MELGVVIFALLLFGSTSREVPFTRRACWCTGNRSHVAFSPSIFWHRPIGSSGDWDLPHPETPRRFWAAGGQTAPGQLLLHGSYDSGTQMDMWHLNLSGWRPVWRQLVLRRDSPSPPPPRHGHVGVIHLGGLIIHGGFDGIALRSDMWFFDPVAQNWTEVQQIAVRASELKQQQQQQQSSRRRLAGGEAAAEDATASIDDAVQRGTPSARYYHAAAYWHRPPATNPVGNSLYTPPPGGPEMIIYGGYDSLRDDESPGIAGDLWTFRFTIATHNSSTMNEAYPTLAHLAGTTTGVWEALSLTSAGKQPSRRLGASLTVRHDETAQSWYVILVGGYDGSHDIDGDENDTYRDQLGVLWFFDMGQEQWFSTVFDRFELDHAEPRPRHLHAAVGTGEFKTEENAGSSAQIIVFGGRGDAVHSTGPRTVDFEEPFNAAQLMELERRMYERGGRTMLDAWSYELVHPDGKWVQLDVQAAESWDSKLWGEVQLVVGERLLLLVTSHGDCHSDPPQPCGDARCTFSNSACDAPMVIAL